MRWEYLPHYASWYRNSGKEGEHGGEAGSLRHSIKEKLNAYNRWQFSATIVLDANSPMLCHYEVK